MPHQPYQLTKYARSSTAPSAARRWSGPALLALGLAAAAGAWWRWRWACRRCQLDDAAAGHA